GDAGRPVERGIPIGRTWRRMTRRIRFADVRLNFDNHAAGRRARTAMDEHFADEIVGDLEGGTVVERPRKCCRSAHGETRGTAARSRAKARVAANATCGSRSLTIGSISDTALTSPDR